MHLEDKGPGGALKPFGSGPRKIGTGLSGLGCLPAGLILRGGALWTVLAFATDGVGEDWGVSGTAAPSAHAFSLGSAGADCALLDPGVPAGATHHLSHNH